MPPQLNQLQSNFVARQLDTLIVSGFLGAEAEYYRQQLEHFSKHIEICLRDVFNPDIHTICGPV